MTAPSTVPRTDSSSPDARVCDVKLNKTDVLEVRGAGDPLVGDHTCQEGLQLRRGTRRLCPGHVLFHRALPGGLLKEPQGKLGRQTVERTCTRQTSGSEAWRLGRSSAPVGPHSRDSRGDHTEVEGHGVQSQNLLPQVSQPGVDGGIGPGEGSQALV